LRTSAYPTRRQTDRARRGGEQRGLADAIAPPEPEHRAGAIGRRVREIDIGVVDDALSDRAIERNGRFPLVMKFARDIARKFTDDIGVAVDEATRGKECCWRSHDNDGPVCAARRRHSFRDEPSPPDARFP
jgi:hypothetical protein